MLSSEEMAVGLGIPLDFLLPQLQELPSIGSLRPKSEKPDWLNSPVLPKLGSHVDYPSTVSAQRWEIPLKCGLWTIVPGGLVPSLSIEKAVLDIAQQFRRHSVH